jgi:hypothetical protein
MGSGLFENSIPVDVLLVMHILVKLGYLRIFRFNKAFPPRYICSQAFPVENVQVRNVEENLLSSKLACKLACSLARRIGLSREYTVDI